MFREQPKALIRIERFQRIKFCLINTGSCSLGSRRAFSATNVFESGTSSSLLDLGDI